MESEVSMSVVRRVAKHMSKKALERQTIMDAYSAAQELGINPTYEEKAAAFKLATTASPLLRDYPEGDVIGGAVGKSGREYRIEWPMVHGNPYVRRNHAYLCHRENIYLRVDCGVDESWISPADVLMAVVDAIKDEEGL